MHSRTLLLTMVAAAAAYIAWLLGIGITATQTFRPQVAQLAVCTAATYLACLLFVPRWGADGAAAGLGVERGTRRTGLDRINVTDQLRRFCVAPGTAVEV